MEYEKAISIQTTLPIKVICFKKVNFFLAHMVIYNTHFLTFHFGLINIGANITYIIGSLTLCMCMFYVCVCLIIYVQAYVTKHTYAEKDIRCPAITSFFTHPLRQSLSLNPGLAVLVKLGG